MTAYLIIGAEIGATRVETFADKSAAEARLANAVPGVEEPWWIFDSAAEIATKPGPLIVKLHNAIAPEGTANVKKFETRGIGAARLFALLETVHGGKPQAQDTASGPAAAPTSAQPTNAEKEGTMPKAKKTKTVRVKKEKVTRTPKDRSYKAKVVSKGSEKAMTSALELIKRANGATAQEIADKLEVSLGTAKNLVWYLRRDGKKIVIDKTKDRKPYVMA